MRPGGRVLPRKAGEPMRQGFNGYKWILALLAGLLLPPAALPEEQLPVEILVGFERNNTTLAGPKGATVRGTEFQFGESPVFKIISPIKLGCLNKLGVFGRRGSTERKGCFGFGIRFSGSQKRLAGPWFDLTADPAAEPVYRFRSDQIAGEVLFGQLSEVSLAVGLGLRVGLNNYDLLVTNNSNSAILFDQRNKFRGFASWAFYLDLQVLLAWPFFGVDSWPFDNVFFLYSFEQTIPGANTFRVPDINNPASEIEVDFQVRTQTLTIEFIF